MSADNPLFQPSVSPLGAAIKQALHTAVHITGYSFLVSHLFLMTGVGYLGSDIWGHP